MMVGTAELATSAGSLIFMHPMTPHSSLPNRSDRGWRMLIFEYRDAEKSPIFTGSGSNLDATEMLTRHLRGEKVRFTRFGNPAPSSLR